MSNLPDLDEDVDEEIVIDLARKTLQGDIRDFLLDRLKHDKSPLPWDQQPEAAQRETIQAAENAAERLIEEVARIVISEGRSVVHVAVDQVVVKDGIKAVVSCPKVMGALEHLGAAQGSTVALVFASTDSLMGQRAPRRAKPDQGDLLTEQADAAAALPEPEPLLPEGTPERVDTDPAGEPLGDLPKVPEPGEPGASGSETSFTVGSPEDTPDTSADAGGGNDAGPQDEPEVTEAKKRRGRPPKAKS